MDQRWELYSYWKLEIWNLKLEITTLQLILSLLLISIAAFALFVPNAPQKLGTCLQEIPVDYNVGVFDDAFQVWSLEALRYKLDGQTLLRIW